MELRSTTQQSERSITEDAQLVASQSTAPPSLPPHRRTLPNYLLEDLEQHDPGSGSASYGSVPSFAGPSRPHDSSLANAFPAVGSEAGPNDATSRGLKRKRKLRQACVYCRRSHLVCEEARPCSRCVKRGIADRCIEASSNEQTSTQNTPQQSDSLMRDDTSSRSPRSAPRHSDVERSAGNTPVYDGSRAQQEQTTPHHHQHHHYQPQQQQHRLMGQPWNPHDASDLKPAIEGSRTRYGDGMHTDHPRSQHAYAPDPRGVNHAGGHPTHRPAAGQTLPATTALNDQPIFQPPSSAELDSLFSSYFFDLTQLFPSPLPPNGVVAGVDALTSRDALHLNSISQAPQAPAYTSAPAITTQNGVQWNNMTSAKERRGDQEGGSAMASSQSAGPRSHSLATTLATGGPATTLRMEAETDGAAHASAPVGGTAAFDGSSRLSRSAPPPSVYHPYPYRKGYASLMWYMTEQQWSPESIRSVEAALAKVRKQWFAVEDAIQPPTLIQLHAEWAGNVRHYTDAILPFAPIAMLVCRKAGEVYASNVLAQQLFGRSREDMEEGRLSVYEVMTESSAAGFFRLYEKAVESHQTSAAAVKEEGRDRSEKETQPLLWDADIWSIGESGERNIVKTRGVFKMKIASCGLPSLLVVCFVPL